MPMDMRRPLIAAIQAALDEVQAEPPKKHRGVGAGRALLLGAGLYTAGRVVVSGRGRGMMDALQQRLPDLDGSGDDSDDADDVDDEYDEEEPDAEADDEPEAEAEEEPEAEEADESDAPASGGSRGRSSARSKK